MKKNKQIYFLPGPANLEEKTLFSIDDLSIPHYGDDFLLLWRKVRSQLQLLVNAQTPPIIFTGSGTSAVEMAATAFVGKKILVISNGHFGNRFAEILQAKLAQVIHLSFPHETSISPQAVKKMLNQHKNITAVAFVHIESSTGIINPVKEIAKIAKNKNKLVLVDMVSSLAAVDIDLTYWGIDVACSSSQKGLASPAGAALVFYSKQFKEFLYKDASRKPSCCWYLDPKIWLEYEELHDWHPYPVTIPSFIIAYMEKNLEQIFKKGKLKHYSRIREASKETYKIFQMLDFIPYASKSSDRSPCITAMKYPQSFAMQKFVEFISSKYNIMIARDIGNICDRLVRVGHFGRAASLQQLELLRSAILDYKQTHL